MGRLEFLGRTHSKLSLLLLVPKNVTNCSLIYQYLYLYNNSSVNKAPLTSVTQKLNFPLLLDLVCRLQQLL